MSNGITPEQLSKMYIDLITALDERFKKQEGRLDEKLEQHRKEIKKEIDGVNQRLDTMNGVLYNEQNPEDGLVVKVRRNAAAVASVKKGGLWLMSILIIAVVTAWATSMFDRKEHPHGYSNHAPILQQLDGKEVHPEPRPDRINGNSRTD